MNPRPTEGRSCAPLTASAVLIDVDLIGEPEARRRVVSLWQPGSRLSALPGRWMLTLPAPVRMRPGREPGQALIADGGGLVAPGLIGRPGTVTIERAGRQLNYTIAEFPEVDRSGWVDLVALGIDQLAPIEREPEPVVVELPEAPAVPDLRARARVGSPRARWPRRVTANAIVVIVALGLSGALAFVLFLQFGHNPHRESAVPPATPTASTPSVVFRTVDPTDVVTLPNLPSISGLGPVVIPRDAPNRSGTSTSPWAAPVWLLTVAGAALLAAAIRRARTVADRRRTGSPASSGIVVRLIARLLQRRGQVRGRRLRYLRRLSDDFERGNWDSALRHAIAMTGDGAMMRLRMPRPRRSLALGQATGGTVTAGFGNVHHFLHSMYEDALRRLESSARIDEAAFLQAEILGDVRGAVSLLERHDRIVTAAQLAEVRRLEPALCVRLWFRAGERDRAIALARARGAFADAVGLLDRVDPDCARALRREWIRSARESGDPEQAVRAAWPDTSLRSLVITDLELGAEDRSPRAGWFLAHLLAVRPTPTVRRMIELLASDEAPTRAHRDAAITAIAETPGTDEVIDRRVTSEALRSILRDGSPARSANGQRALIGRLRKRADPVLVADLPAATSQRIPIERALPHVTLGDRPGDIGLSDAVVLGDGRILTAHSESGARLLSHDGRTVRSWERRVDRIVLADHGRTAVLAGYAGRYVELSKVSLESLRMDQLPLLSDAATSDSYDGLVLPVIEGRGILFLDMIDERHRAVWRELDEQTLVLSLNRTPRRMTALLRSETFGAGSEFELWSWELPSLTLRRRSPVVLDPDVRSVATTPAGLLAVRGADEGSLRLTRYALDGERIGPERTDLPTGSSALHSGAVHALFEPSAGAGLLTVFRGNDMVATVQLVGNSSPLLRCHADITTVATDTGQIAGIELRTGRIVAEHSTTR